MKPNSYPIPLTDATFHQEVLASRQPALVEFRAEWCGACHILAPVLEDLAAAFSGKVRFFRLDVDIHRNACDAYGIHDLPVLLFFKNGQLADHVLGAAPKATILSKLKGLLSSGNPCDMLKWCYAPE